jgi:hypothetical protein
MGISSLFGLLRSLVRDESVSRIDDDVRSYVILEIRIRNA